jgi:uncharacterized protein
MLLNIRKLMHKDVESIDFQFNNLLNSDVSDMPKDIKLPIEIEFKGLLKREGDTFTMAVEMKGNIGYECSRCLSDTVYILDESELFEINFTDPKDENYHELESFNINLEEIVMQELIVHLPTHVLCNDGCKGLCPSCGVNLNLDKCACEEMKVDPRFESLKDFFKSHEEV